MKKSAALKALALSISVLALLTSCAKVYNEPGNSTVNAAIQFKVSSVTAASATVSAEIHGDGITSLTYVPVQKYPSQVDYLSMDASQRLAYIKEHGESIDCPFLKKESGLDPETSYSVAAFGVDANGVIRTAPTFFTFKSESAVAAVVADYLGEIEGKYQFKLSISPNDFVDNYKYVITQDEVVVKMSEEKLREYLIAGGPEVKTSTDAVAAVLNLDEKKDLIVATLAYDELGRACTLDFEVASTKTVVFFNYNGKSIQLNRVGTDETIDIFDGTFDVKKDARFHFIINKDEYGFESFSGNGGVGQNECEDASMPYYAIKKWIDNKSHTNKYFYISESLGRLVSIENGGKDLWVNTTEDGKLYVKVDITSAGAIPHYYTKWLKDFEDEKIVLKQNFDLCAVGAYYLTPYTTNVGTLYPQGATLRFSSNPGFDGTIAGEKGKGNGTSIAIARTDYPVLSPGGLELAPKEYMQNKGLDGWTMINFCEQAGAIVLGNGNYKGRATTPFLTKLTGPTNITIEFDTVGYGNNTDDFAVYLVGPGTFTSCEVTTADGKTNPAVEDKKVLLPKGTIKTYATSEHKTYSHFKATVSGADASTQVTFAFDESAVNNNQSRSVFDNVLITK